eukprot:5018639-Pleurochrysis_carterae.AAC.1
MELSPRMRREEQRRAARRLVDPVLRRCICLCPFTCIGRQWRQSCMRLAVSARGMPGTRQPLGPWDALPYAAPERRPEVVTGVVGAAVVLLAKVGEGVRQLVPR